MYFYDIIKTDMTIPEGMFAAALRIIVFSDSHGDYQILSDIIRRHINDTDIFIHLGDGQREFLKITQMFPDKKMLSVPGNCDWAGSTETTKILHVSGRKILYTHGHTYRVKSGLDMLKEAAIAQDAHIALFGHTHIPASSFDGRLHLFNPGSVIRGAGGINPSYGIIELSKNSVEPRIMSL